MSVEPDPAFLDDPTLLLDWSADVRAMADYLAQLALKEAAKPKAAPKAKQARTLILDTERPDR